MVGIIGLIVFWGSAIKLWVVDGPKIPIIFILIWLIGLFGFQRMGVKGYCFIIFEVILAVILIIVERYKSHVGTSVF